MRSGKRVFDLRALAAVALAAALIGAGAVLVLARLNGRQEKGNARPDGAGATAEALGSLCRAEPPASDGLPGNTVCHTFAEDETFFTIVGSSAVRDSYAAGESVEFYLTLLARDEASTRLRLEGAYLELNIEDARAVFSEIRRRPADVHACTDSVPALCQIGPYSKTLVFSYLVGPGHSAPQLAVERLVLGENGYVLGPDGESLLPPGGFLDIRREFDFGVGAP